MSVVYIPGKKCQRVASENNNSIEGNSQLRWLPLFFFASRRWVRILKQCWHRQALSSNSELPYLVGSSDVDRLKENKQNVYRRHIRLGLINRFIEALKIPASPRFTSLSVQLAKGPGPMHRKCQQCYTLLTSTICFHSAFDMSPAKSRRSSICPFINLRQ